MDIIDISYNQFRLYGYIRYGLRITVNKGTKPCYIIYLPNVLHIEMVSINPIIGNTITPEPMFVTISKNPIVVPLSFVTLNFGRSKLGKPDGILPGKLYLTV